MTSYRSSQSAAYPKKRPSPSGISKHHKMTTLGPPVICQTPCSVKAALLQQQGIFLEEEYREDIRFYMHEMERYTMSSLQSMDQQPKIRWHMRPCLVDFLIEIYFTFQLQHEMLYLTLNIVDHYHYQLVGCMALWIAAKFEDAKECVPTVQELAQICHDTYDESAFIQMEGHVLQTIQWTLGHPTAEAWLRLMCCEPSVEEEKVQHVARFLMEITLFHREFIRYPPSPIALGALMLALFLCGKPCHIFEEMEECLEIIDCVNNRLAKLYTYAFYSKAPTFVVQYYLQGGRFIRWSFITLLMMPTPPSIPSSLSPEPFSNSFLSEDDKEFFPTMFELVINKQCTEVPPDHLLPHDFITFGHPALHHLNGSP
ncbi:cyclin-like protein [Suillus subalutaceus]|uniref:cyclin-like protein n=1 Tax=Suillus subalutaceus TaxID=48586 RepID=UPI001B85BB8F|nr:cyclin-like protein [Suillus subalutaceus]KAG1859539.1 cyclin-like protein [Suillus subalutaceus]